MIGRVTFETAAGVLRPQEDYGLLLKTYDVTPPKVKVYRVELDGADGAVDFSEWAGGLLYESRTVTIELRDMHNRHSEITRQLLGRMARITLSDAPDWYYYGRCDDITTDTERRVTDMALTFTCQPYRLAHKLTSVQQSVTTTHLFTLQTRRAPAIPQITLTSAATVGFGGKTYDLAEGTHTVAAIVLTDSPKNLRVTGNTTATITWRDGEF